MTEKPRIYNLSQSFVYLHYIGVGFFGAMATLSLFLPVIVNGPGLSPSSAYAISIGMALIFAGFGIASYLVVRKAQRFSISVDEEGLWKSQEPRNETLLKWGSIKSVHQRASGQRLELIGFTGEHLLDIEYQLTGFDELRVLILSKIRKSERPYPQRYQKKRFYLPLHFVLAALLLAGVWYYVFVGKVFLAFGIFMVLLLVAYGFVTSVTAITLWRDRILVEYPWRKFEILSRDIETLVFNDIHDKGTRVPQVGIKVNNGRVIKLQYLGIDETELFRELSELISVPSQLQR